MPSADMAAYMKRRHQEQRARAIRYLGGACSKCGETDDLVFHHTDPTTKSFTISSGLKFGWDRLVIELGKCELVCDSCHRSHHGSSATHGTPQRFWRGCRCDPCLVAMRQYRRMYRESRAAGAIG